jgi:fatty acid desaturase
MAVLEAELVGGANRTLHAPRSIVAREIDVEITAVYVRDMQDQGAAPSSKATSESEGTPDDPSHPLVETEASDGAPLAPPASSGIPHLPDPGLDLQWSPPKQIPDGTADRIPNRLNLAIMVGQLLCIAGCLFALKHAQGAGALLLLAILFGVLMNSVYSIIHEAEHAMLFSNRLWNDVAGSFMALFFPAPFHLIRQGHLGHHLRNRSDDEAFDLYFEGDHKVWRFLVFYGILTGLYYLVVVLSNVVFLLLPFGKDKNYWHVDQASTAFMNSLNPRYRHLTRMESAAAILLHTGIVWLLNIPVTHYLVMYAGFGFMWSAMQYVHHYGTERHVTRGARNLWIWKPLDLLWLNHNWHLRHHEHPSLPWIYLSRGEDGETPERGFLLTAYLRMWRGPKRASKNVPNPHADKIIP